MANKAVDEENPERDLLADAAFAGDVEAVQRLIAAGHDLNAYAIYGGTPLHSAIENQQAEVVELLLGAGADINESGPSGWTPLAHAVDCLCDTVSQGLGESEQDEAYELVMYLLQRGADAKAVDGRGRSAADIARGYGEHQLAAWLDEAAKPPNTTAG